MLHSIIFTMMSLFMALSSGSNLNEVTTFATSDTYTITYELNGGTLSGYNNPDIVDIGATYTLPRVSEVTKTDYIFIGWYKSASFSGPRYTRLSSMHDSDVTLFAKYQLSLPPDITHDITYVLNGGSFVGEANLNTYDEGTPYLLPTNNVIKEGFNFIGWYLLDEVTKVETIDETYTRDLTLIARYEEIIIEEEEPIIEESTFPYGIEYKINYNLKGGAMIDDTYPTSYIAGVGCLLPQGVNKDNYDFIGWSTRNLSGVIITRISNRQYGDVWLNANYHISPNANKYTITYIDNGGTIKEEYSNSYLDEEVILPTIVVLDHASFDGWYESKDFNTTRVYKINNNDTGNKVFYAKYVREVYSIIYYLGEGTINEEYKDYYHHGEEVILPTKVSHDTNTFIGFSEVEGDSTNLVTKINKGESGTKVYYAVYESTYSNLNWLWILIPIIAVILGGGIGFYIYKRKKTNATK